MWVTALGHKEKPDRVSGRVEEKAWQRAIFAVKTIVAAEGLNGRVRNENGCDPLAMATTQKIKSALATTNSRNPNKVVKSMVRLVPVG